MKVVFPVPRAINGSSRLELSDDTDFIVGAFAIEYGKWLEGFTHRLNEDDIKWIKSRNFIKGWYHEGVYGRASTGVLSRADLQANRQGFEFYRELWLDPTTMPDICRFVGELWNERKELNTYDPGVGTPQGPASSSMEAENP